MSGDEAGKRPEGWYSKEQRAARAAAHAERRREAAARRAEVENARKRAADAAAPINAAARRRLARLPQPNAKEAKLREAQRAIHAAKAEKSRRERDIIDVRTTAPVAAGGVDKAALARMVEMRRPTDAGEPSHPATKPTPERMAKGDFVEAGVFDSLPGGGRSLIGRAWQAKPKFERIEGLNGEQRRALAYYRTVFDRSEQSEVKSGLDIRPRGAGGSDGMLARIEALAFSADELKRIEAAIGANLDTLRHVALFDLDFKEVAILRYGSREVSRVDTRQRKPKVSTSIEPRSGRHREMVREQFFAATDRLVIAVRPALTSALERMVRAAIAGEARPIDLADEGVAAAVACVDPEFLDERGLMLPWDKIKAIIIARIAAPEEGV